MLLAKNLVESLRAETTIEGLILNGLTHGTSLSLDRNGKDRSLGITL
jgi:hypothetical protein